MCMEYTTILGKKWQQLNTMRLMCTFKEDSIYISCSASKCSSRESLFSVVKVYVRALQAEFLSRYTIYTSIIP